VKKKEKMDELRIELKTFRIFDIMRSGYQFVSSPRCWFGIGKYLHALPLRYTPIVPFKAIVFRRCGIGVVFCHRIWAANMLVSDGIFGCNPVWFRRSHLHSRP
jgi:hypothetical protein